MDQQRESFYTVREFSVHDLHEAEERDVDFHEWIDNGPVKLLLPESLNMPRR